MSAKPKLTPHQVEVYSRIERRLYNNPDRLIPLEHIGCVGAVNKLHVKGYIKLVQGHAGPRGGERWFIRSVEEHQ